MIQPLWHTGLGSAISILAGLLLVRCPDEEPQHGSCGGGYGDFSQVVQERVIQNGEIKPEVTVKKGKCELRNGSVKEFAAINWQLERSEGRWRLTGTK
jgi:hypothetical protein